MFTGIVETIGIIGELTSTDNGVTLLITQCPTILEDAHNGDSISINGTCLTITSFTKSEFLVGVAPETLRRTNLGDLKTGDGVNLERAVSSSTRMGGHFVQGHVDTVARIVSIKADGEALTFRLSPREPSVLRYIVEKGYVTLDGASLTITTINDKDGWFEVMLITYTQSKVVMGGKIAGNNVNVEVDMVGKYIEKSVESYLGGLQPGQGGGLEGIISKLIDAKLRDRI